MIVVDTNLVAALYLRGVHTSLALELLKADHVWCTEPFVLIELTNVLATCHRAGQIPRSIADNALRDARALLEASFHTVAHETALEIACRYGITAYDARFVAVAQERAGKLTTQDERLRRAVPALTQSAADTLATISRDS